MTYKRMNNLNKVLNKSSGRYVLKTGKIGKRIMQERRERREEKKAEKIARLVIERLQQVEAVERIAPKKTINRRQMLNDIQNFEYLQQVENEQNQMIESDVSFQLVEQQKEMQAAEQVRELRARLYAGDVQSGFDLFVIQRTTAQDDKQIIKLLDSIAVAQKILIRFTLSDGSTIERTLGKDNRDELLEILKDGFITFTARTHTSGEMARIIAMGIVRMELIKVSEKSLFENKGISKSGNYFKYINESNIDLTRYQIIRTNDNQDLINENCLMYALKVLNIDEALIQSVKTRIKKGAYVAKSNLPTIGDIIKKNINLHQYTLNKKECEETKQYTQKFIINKNYDTIDLCLYDDHFFIYEHMDITEYAIKNYSKLKDIENYHTITRITIKKNKTYYERDLKKNKTDCLTVIKNLGTQGYFKENILLSQTDQSTMIEDKITLDNIENEQRLYKYKPRKPKEQIIFFADTETDTTYKHTPLLIGVIKMMNDNYLSNVRIFKRFDQERKESEKYTNLQLMMFQFLNYLIAQDKESDIIVYFHNLKFDFYVLLESLYLQDICQKAGAVYNVQFRYKSRLIEFRDSYKMATMPLCEFQKSFNLSQDLNKKEYIAYKYYKVKNQHKKTVKLSRYVKYLKVKDIEPFYNLIRSSDNFEYNRVRNTFNPWAYYEYYLRYDCLVLCEGMKVFNKTIAEITEGKMSVFDSLTISSLTNKYMGMMGAFDGVYEMCGALRDYASQSVTGGRVLVNERFKKKVIEGKIADYDGVSLYPSSIYRLCKEYGLPIGKAQKIIDMMNIEQYDYYIVNARITQINKKQDMPFISFKNAEGILNYTNEIPECGYIDVCIDRYTLEDYKTFHQIEYSLIDGIFWNEGFNKKMGEVVEKLFNERLRYKKLGNDALQLILKLMMNSSYGKTIISKSTTRTEIKDHSNEKKFNEYIDKNFYTIKEIQQINDRQSMITRTQFDKSYNMAHIGTMILSTSKRIMNEVFDIANTHGLNIYYTDTDSIHMDYDAVPKLEEEFLKKYNRQLTGKNMGQFHIDFSMKHNGDAVKNEIYAIKSLFLGKKSYIDLLESTDKEGNKIQGLHYRLKGMTTEGIEHGAEKFGGDIFKLYEHMIGNETTLILNPKDKFMIEYAGKRAITRKEGDFPRTMDFRSEQEKATEQAIMCVNKLFK
jgi:hypothetical protein